MNKALLKVRRFRDGATLPTRGSDLSSGFDLYAWTPEGESVIIPPNEMHPIKTGINTRFPANYELQIRPRSGLAFKHQITVQNTPGTVDADYDGDGEKFEIVVLLRNEGKQPFVVNRGDRIAQMVLNQLPEVELVEDFDDNLNRNQSNRSGGFGSTGTN